MPVDGGLVVHPVVILAAASFACREDDVAAVAALALAVWAAAIVGVVPVAELDAVD